MTSTDSRAYLDAYDYGRFARIIDIGGGSGAFMGDILKRHPQVRGAIMDLPHVVEQAGAILDAVGVSGRCELIPGSFFDAVPEGYDAYVVKHILHDWTDEECNQILAAVGRAMHPDARLLVHERVVGPPNEDLASKLSDLNMLVMPGGKERTEDEWRELLDGAAFSVTEIVPSGSGAVIEAAPV